MKGTNLLASLLKGSVLLVCAFGSEYAHSQDIATQLKALRGEIAALKKQNSALAADLEKVKTKANRSGGSGTGTNTTGPFADQLTAGTKKLNLDRPISAVPAFTALDLAPETVAHPSTPRDFAASLLNGVDRQGVLQTGIAIETTPFRFLPGWKQDFPHYADRGITGYWTRFLYDFSLSLATTKASENKDDKAVKLAIGAQAILWQDEQSNPRLNPGLQAAFNRAYGPAVRVIPPGAPIPDEEVAPAETFDEAITKFRAEQWMGTLWTASIAPNWISQSGKADDLKPQGFTAWTTFAYALEKPLFDGKARVQLLAHARYRQDEMITDPKDKDHSVEQDSFLAAGRVRIGAPEFNAFAEGGYIRI